MEQLEQLDVPVVPVANPAFYMRIRRPQRRCQAERWLDPKISRATRARCQPEALYRWRGKPGCSDAGGFAALFWDCSACIELNDGTLTLAMRSTTETIAALVEKGRADLGKLLVWLVEKYNTRPPERFPVRIRRAVVKPPVRTYVKVKRIA
jgi:hypothetical protein